VFQAPETAFSMNSRRHRPSLLTKMHKQMCSRFTIEAGAIAGITAVGEGFVGATGDMVAAASGAIADVFLRSSCGFSC
jgi:hypothetical protein